MRFPEFSGEWENTSLGKIGKTFNGLTGKSGSDFGQGFPYITYKSIFDDSKINISRVEYVEITDVERKKETQNKVQYGDVFFTTSSETPDEVGMTSVLLDEVKDCYLNSFCFGYRLNSLSKTLPEYMRFYLRSQTIRKKMFVLAQGSTRFNISKSEVMGMSISIPEIKEQRKIANLLTLLDDRIATQNKIIEDLKKLKSAIIERSYCNRSCRPCRIGNVIEQISERNKNKSIDTILSVSNRLGFINQSEQFEDRIIASEDTSNYKIVYKNDFAYNPARINVGSIARLTTFDTGIVSPMYICFRVRKGIASEYMEHFFSTSYFFYEMQKRLEGSVRQCLSFEGICNIPIYIPSLKEQHRIGRKLSVILDKIDIETYYLSKLKEQKQYMLRQMFI